MNLKKFFGKDEEEFEFDDSKSVTENRIRGRIFKLSEAGYGFITSKDIKFTRIFFHWTALNPTSPKFTELHKGMRVEFTPVEVPDKGWRAIRIEVIEDEKPA